jgi:hypothetical protein
MCTRFSLAIADVWRGLVQCLGEVLQASLDGQ